MLSRLYPIARGRLSAPASNWAVATAASLLGHTSGSFQLLNWHCSAGHSLGRALTPSSLFSSGSSSTNKSNSAAGTAADTVPDAANAASASSNAAAGSTAVPTRSGASAAAAPTTAAAAAAAIVVRDSSNTQGRLVTPKPPKPSASAAAAAAAVTKRSLRKVQPDDNAAAASGAPLSAGDVAYPADHAFTDATAADSAVADEALDAFTPDEAAAGLAGLGLQSLSVLEQHSSSSSGVVLGSGAAAAGLLDAPEALRIIQLAQRQAQKGAVSFQSLSKAIVKALELARLHPHLDARDLLHPAIAELQLSYVDRAVRRMKHVLPDTKLRAELLAKDPHEVSEQITRIVAAFKARLGMQPPSQLLSDAWTFTKALRLPDQQLQAHLKGLLQLVDGDVAAAQRLAQQHAGVLLSRSFEGMLQRAGKLGKLLGLQQGHAAAEFALRYPYLVSGEKQLDKVESMLAEAPDALQLPLHQLLPCFVAHPALIKYENVNLLAQRYRELAACFNGPAGIDALGAPSVLPSDLLALCAATSVRRAAGPGAVTESLNTAAAICGYSSPAALLPLLLQPPKLETKSIYSSNKHARASGAASAAAAAAAGEISSVAAAWGGVGRRGTAASLLQPAAVLRKRAAALLQVQGLSREDAAALLRWSPESVLHRDPKTTHLKLVLLQRQLLGWEPAHSSARAESVAPELTKMVKKCPWIVNLQMETCSKRLAALQAALQLTEEAAGRLVLRSPQLLLLKAELLQQLVGEIVQLTGGVDAARKLVLEDPRVLIYKRQANNGGFKKQLTMLQSVLAEAKQQEQQHLAHPILLHQQDPGATAASTAAAAAAAAAAAIEAAASRASACGLGSSHGMRGIRKKGAESTCKWEMRSGLVYSKPKQYGSWHATSLEAAVAFDLVRLAVQGEGAAVNLPASVYAAADVAAMAGLVRVLRQMRFDQQQQQPPRQQQRQQQQETALELPVQQQQQQRQQQTASEPPVLHQPDPAAVAAAKAEAAAAAAISAAACRARNHGLGSSHGMRGIRKRHAGVKAKWQMSSKLVYRGSKLYTSSHGTSLEAAAAFDLVKLAVQHKRPAVNLPDSVYAAEDVAAMAALVQLKRQMHFGQQQQQQQHGTKSGAAEGRMESSNLKLEHPQQQQQQQEQTHQQQQVQSVEHQQQQQLLLQCLTVKAGRQLLTLRPETGLARLQALAAATGSSCSNLLSRGLRNGRYLDGVVGLSAGRMQDAALALQQQLGLQEAYLQQLLQKAPRLLLCRRDAVQQKVALLLPAFQQLWDAVQAAAAAAAAAGDGTASHPEAVSRGFMAEEEQQQQQSRRRRRRRRQSYAEWLEQQFTQQQQPQQQQQQQHIPLQQLQDRTQDSSADAGVAALQRAVMSMPEVLMSSPEKVVRRLQVLQQCCSHPVLAVQVQKVLHTGTIGRWLVAGDAQFDALEALVLAAEQQQQQQGLNSSSSSSSSNSAVLQALNLDQLMRCAQARVQAYLQQCGADA